MLGLVSRGKKKYKRNNLGLWCKFLGESNEKLLQEEQVCFWARKTKEHQLNKNREHEMSTLNSRNEKEQENSRQMSRDNRKQNNRRSGSSSKDTDDKTHARDQLWLHDPLLDQLKHRRQTGKEDSAQRTLSSVFPLCPESLWCVSWFASFVTWFYCHLTHDRGLLSFPK